MFVIYWTSHCWSKLNAEVHLFYFPPFYEPTVFVCLLFVFLGCFFFGRRTDLSGKVPSLQSLALCFPLASSPAAPQSRFFSLGVTGTGSVTSV